MHIHRFADVAQFSEIGIGGTLPATEEYRELLKRLHPTQILTGRVSFPLYEVKYSYLTARHNYRTAKKYIFLNAAHEDFDCEIEMALRDWADLYNRNYPYRRISNVQILEIRRIAYANISLQA